MSDPDYKLCDICGEPCNARDRFAMDAAEDYPARNVDLCPYHMRDVLLSLIEIFGDKGRSLVSNYILCNSTVEDTDATIGRN